MYLVFARIFEDRSKICAHDIGGAVDQSYLMQFSTWRPAWTMPKANKVVTVDDYKVKLQIWDTAGQERFRSVTHAYYRDAHALLLLYDVSNKTSFDNTRAWLGEINEYAQDDVVIMLIGNKADIMQDRQVRTEDGERLSREYGVAFMETSAKTGCNVELAFMAVARELKQRASRSVHGASGRFNMTEYIRQESQAKPNGCCSS
ncbi:hypothetical protein HPB49_017139 [Dermacentor silvarum]|uniref:Uncharacterized protein n=1 Tax=Dermacentor silvarum TaxID=543639 RepID=A0ACB8CSC5_DERSI|nr:hypothetical protein HPB49_017139 [Dermacentor silvarum]